MSDRPRRVWHGEVAGEGCEIVLGAEEARHATVVLRLRPGDRVAVFDGRGGEWEGVLSASRGRDVRVRVGRSIPGTVDPALPIVLYLALCRPERIDWGIEKGTEVGVAEFRLFASRRSRAAEASAARVARWARVARESAKQCGRRVVPDVVLASGLPPAPPAGVAALLLDPLPSVPPLADRLAGPRAPEVWLAVGPEGGLEPDESAVLRTSGWEPCRVGPRTLRAETAGTVAAALVLASWGDLGRSRG